MAGRHFARNVSASVAQLGRLSFLTRKCLPDPSFAAPRLETHWILPKAPKQVAGRRGWPPDWRSHLVGCVAGVLVSAREESMNWKDWTDQMVPIHNQLVEVDLQYSIKQIRAMVVE